MSLAFAAPEITDLGASQRFVYPDGTSFVISEADVIADLARSGAHPVNDLVAARAAAVVSWSSGLRPDQTVTVEVNQNQISYAVRAPEGEADALLEQAKAVSEAARARFLAANGYEDANGRIRPAHQSLVVRYTELVRPVAEALGSSSTATPEFAAKALRFVQTIPYERASDDADTYRRPLAVLHGDIGDCDSKAVLYLALLRAHDPTLATALVYVKNHLYVGLGISGGGRSLSTGGERFLLAEPAGPGTLPIGTLDERHAELPIKDVRIVR